MTHDLATFQADIRSVPEIMTLVDSVAESAEFQESVSETKSIEPLSAGLSLVAAAALWKLLSLGIDTLRGMSEDAALERRIRVIEQVRDMGYERQAPLIVDRLLKEMRRRPADDPLLKKLAGLYQG